MLYSFSQNNADCKLMHNAGSHDYDLHFSIAYLLLLRMLRYSPYKQHTMSNTGLTIFLCTALSKTFKKVTK